MGRVVGLLAGLVLAACSPLQPEVDGQGPTSSSTSPPSGSTGSVSSSSAGVADGNGSTGPTSTTTTSGTSSGTAGGTTVAVGSSSSGGPALGECDRLYGSLPQYTLCEQTDTLCEFAVRTNSQTCNIVCSGVGGECVDAFDNDIPVCLPTGIRDDCDTERQTEICLCTRFVR